MNTDERLQSPETYIGYGRSERFGSPERIGRDVRRTCTSPGRLSVHRWALSGTWNVSEENAELQAAGGRIVFRFHARDLHLALRSPKPGTAVRFKVTLDGLAPGGDHGVDSDAEGNGEVREPRLYQVIRQKQSGQDRTFAIEFLDPGVQGFVFTFG